MRRHKGLLKLRDLNPAIFLDFEVGKVYGSFIIIRMEWRGSHLKCSLRNIESWQSHDVRLILSQLNLFSAI